MTQIPKEVDWIFSWFCRITRSIPQLPSAFEEKACVVDGCKTFVLHWHAKSGPKGNLTIEGDCSGKRAEHFRIIVSKDSHMVRFLGDVDFDEFNLESSGWLAMGEEMVCMTLKYLPIEA